MSNIKSETNNKINKNIIFYPTCYYKNCKGVLEFNIDPYNFSIDCKCQNDQNHNRSCIYFKTFEKYFLEKDENFICSKCGNMDNNQIFECLDCKNLCEDSKYCTYCLVKDITKNGHKNFQAFNEYKCKIHNLDFSDYCEDCKKNVCIKCIEENDHLKHSTYNYMKKMLTSQEILEMEMVMEEKFQYINKLIDKINDWKNEIRKKTNELVQNLKDELDLFKKIFSNYNKNVLNYNYYKSIRFFKDYLKSAENEDLSKFYKAINLKEQTLALGKVFNNLGTKKQTISTLRGSFDESRIGFKFIEKINHKYLFCQSDNFLSIRNESDNCIKYLNSTKLDFKDEIKSISHIPNENLILICVSNNKLIKFITYNLTQKSMSFLKKQIYDNTQTSKNYFNKCILINKNVYVTSDDKYITLWIEDNKNFILKNKTEIDCDTPDLLLMDNKNFISCQPNNKTLTIYNNKNLNLIKIIADIDCVNSDHCLFLFKKYVLINCLKGIRLFLIETKEIVQFIENCDLLSENKKLTYDENECFYTFKLKKQEKKNVIKIVKLNFGNNSIDINKFPKEYMIEGEGYDIIYVNENKLYFNGNKLYAWEREHDIE